MNFSAKEYCSVKNPRFGGSMFLHENLVEPAEQTSGEEALQPESEKSLVIEDERIPEEENVQDRERDLLLRESVLINKILAEISSFKQVNQTVEGILIKRIEAGPGIEVTFPEPGVVALNISPSLTLNGTPKAPTPSQGSSNDQIATTKYVDTAVSAAIQAIIAAMTNSR